MLVLKGASSARKVVKLMASGSEALTAATNLAELYYKAEEKLGRQTAVAWFNRIAHLRNLRVVPADEAIALAAGRIKARYRRELSLADSIIAAVAWMEGATLFTTDSRLEVLEEIEVEVLPLD